MTSDKKFCPVCLETMQEKEPTKNPLEATEQETSSPTKQIEQSENGFFTEEKQNTPEEIGISTDAENTAAQTEHSPSQAPLQIDPEALQKELEEHKAAKKRKQKKIIIGSVIGATILILGIILIVIATADRISFNKSTAQDYDAYGLTCYAPESWVYTKNHNYNNEEGYYYSPDNNDRYIAYIGAVYLGEFDKYDDVLRTAKKIGIPTGKFGRVSIKNCRNAKYGEYKSDDSHSWMCCGYIVLCDRSGFYLWGTGNNDVYDAQTLSEIILASDFNFYDSTNICDYLGGHKFGEWTESVPSTCTEKGKETAKCSVCLGTYERELDLIPHEVEEGETVESTCIEKGSVTGTCSICGEEITEELPLADHTPGDWIVDKEATESTEGTHHKECTVCGKKLESESFTLSPEEIKATYNTGITYNQLSRDPDEYKGQKVKFSGRVLQVIEGDYSTALRVATKGRYDNVIHVQYLKGLVKSRILEDDTITIYGTSAGLYTYESTGSGYITIPQISVDYIDQ